MERGARAKNFYKTLLFQKIALERLYATIGTIRRWRLDKSEVRWNLKVCLSTRFDLFMVEKKLRIGKKKNHSSFLD